jgi:hypothetical protein
VTLDFGGGKLGVKGVTEESEEDLKQKEAKGTKGFRVEFSGCSFGEVAVCACDARFWRRGSSE